ncbi:colicin transporter [Brenneria izbisi]|uniref:Colicin transporter n=1 Tax=Brenneria izbisi TaxID=2939450 RepID=A0AA42C6V6_9GAMM|nr:colicin transporter [Brenneria izbisi]MCV9880644.1 colicin transporter [Brenneria izbisi]MCV9884062.1 colicin transporter [Brenneria izbisi]
MSFNKKIIYDNGNDFFKFKGDSVMVLTPKAAKEVCAEATKRNKFVWIVEGGHWLSPGYRPDSATRWDARPELEKANKIKENNELNSFAYYRSILASPC